MVLIIGAWLRLVLLPVEIWATVEVGARVSKKGGTSKQVEALQAQAISMGRKVGRNDASIIAGAKNNNATVVTNDKRMTKFMNSISQPVKGF